MTLINLLKSKHSKSTTDDVIAWVGSSDERFMALMNCVLGAEPILAQRAAWAMSYIVIQYPKLIYPYLNQLLNTIKSPVHPALKRNTFRFLKEIEIPEQNIPLVIDACFAMVSNQKENIAIICFAFFTLLKIAKKYPEIKNEILFATELHFENESHGLQNTIQKIKKQLAKG